MNIFVTILSFILILVVILGVYGVCKRFVFSKVRINKWIPLSIAILLFIVQIIIGETNVYIRTGLMGFITIFFLWFMEIMQTGGPKKKEKQIVIKSKAKPNRVKKDK
jgi:Ca2+/Na+ antiporter